MSELRPLIALLEELSAVRPPADGEAWLAGLLRRWRERRLSARLERDWPGGFTLHRTGDLVYVPRPLDRRGRAALLQPPQAHPAALAFLRPGGVVIDIGAALGAWTLPLARAVGASGRVLAIEPAPASAAALEMTLAANALRQAEIVRCAVGEEDGTAEFAVPAVTSGRVDIGSAHVGPAEAGEEALTVPLRSLDSLAAERRLPRLDLVRIDVVGHQRRVVDGAAEVLDRFRPVLVLETGHEGPGDRAAIHYRLRHLGYRVLGILLEHGMAEAAWPAYIAAEPPFRPGDPQDLLLIPEEE